MAAAGLALDKEYFCCSICLDLLKDPVSIPCGHSYCMSCINTHWDGEVGKLSYSCPQCRHSFTFRPGLVKNTMLAALMEELKSGKTIGAPTAPLSPSAAHGHVFCDLCSGTKVKAEKSCLQCLVSYCKEHLQPHYDVPALKRHKLAEPIENLQENMCSVHDEVMKMFCRTDQQCICYLCSVDKHKGHHTVTAAAERTVKQRELQTFHQNILQRIEHKEKDLDGLQHHLKNSSRSADAAVEHSERSLKELRLLLQKRMSFVKQQIRSQQETEEHRVKELQDKVQQQVSELKGKLTELDTLSHTEDHVHFLHKFASLSKVSQTSESVNSSQSPPPFQDMVTAAVAKLRRSLQDTSLMDPPAVSNKPQVNTAKTDALPAGAQGTAASQQRQKQPQPLQENGPPPQSSEEDEQSQSSEEDELSQSSEEDELSQSSEEDVLSQFFEGGELSRIFEEGELSQSFEEDEQSQSFEEDEQSQSSEEDVPSRRSEEDEQWRRTSLVNNLSERTPSDRPDGILRVILRKDCFLCNLENKEIVVKTENGDMQARRSEVHGTMDFPIHTPRFSDTVPQPDFLKLKECFRTLTWDPRSFNDHLELHDVEGCLKLCNHRSLWENKPASPSHPFKFTKLCQAVSNERLTGQCYFEMTVWMSFYSTTTASVTVAYEDIRRDGCSDECCFGMNDKSWALECHHYSQYTHGRFWHNGNKVEIPMCIGPRVGVFVDYDAGILSFYTKRRKSPVLVYTVKTTFTRPLVAGVLFKQTGCQAIFEKEMWSPRVFQAPSDCSLTQATTYWQLGKYSQKITWDPRSLHNKLILSECYLDVIRIKRGQNYPPSPFRFKKLPQAVSKEHLTGRCFFEIFTSVHRVDQKNVTIAVAYKDMRRDSSSRECLFGMNDKSWALECHRNHSVFLHNGNRVDIAVGGNNRSTTIGVFVDYEAGILCFYRKDRLIHSVKTTFTQPLLAGVRLKEAGCRALISEG